MSLFDSLSNSWNNIWNYNGIPTSYNGLMNQYNNLGNQLVDAQAANQSTDAIMANMDNISNQLTNVENAARYFNVQDPSQLSPAQIAQYNQLVGQNTGLTGWVNNNLGGWGNVFSGLQAGFNLYSGLQQLGIMKDQLGLQQDAFNFNKAVTSRNLANQVEAYNTSLADRYRARAYTETGNANAYNDQIKQRSLSSKL